MAASKNYWISGAPPGDHPILLELGRFHAKFATLEVTLNELMAFALGLPQQMGHAILANTRSIADRITIIEDVTKKAEQLSELQKFTIAHVCTEARKLNSRRNRYAHGRYEYRGDKIRVTPFGYEAPGQPEFLKVAKVKADCEKIDELLIKTMIFSGAIPQEILDQLPELPK